MELIWKRNRTSAPRTKTWHTATSKFGLYEINKIGKTYSANFVAIDASETYIGAYHTLKEAKREAGYHNGRLVFNAAIANSSPKLWREEA